MYTNRCIYMATYVEHYELNVKAGRCNTSIKPYDANDKLNDTQHEAKDKHYLINA